MARPFLIAKHTATRSPFMTGRRKTVTTAPVIFGRVIFTRAMRNSLAKSVPSRSIAADAISSAFNFPMRTVAYKGFSLPLAVSLCATCRGSVASDSLEPMYENLATFFTCSKKGEDTSENGGRRSRRNLLALCRPTSQTSSESSSPQASAPSICVEQLRPTMAKHSPSQTTRRVRRYSQSCGTQWRTS